MDVSSRIDLFDLPHKLFQIRVRQVSRRDREFFLHPVVLLPVQGVHHLFLKETQHADAIFQLDVSVIASFLRHLPFRQNIPLVACMDKMDPVALIIDLLPFFDQVDDLTGIFLCKRFQRIKAVTVFRESDRNNRHTLHYRRIL